LIDLEFIPPAFQKYIRWVKDYNVLSLLDKDYKKSLSFFENLPDDKQEYYYAPGKWTVTEIIQQYSMGANLCKVFPAKQLGGPGYIKAIDPAIHKIISLVPTGGTNASNIPDYIDAGVLALGGSFSMIEKATMRKIIEEQDYDLLAKELTVIKRMIDKLRAEKYPDIDFAEASLEQISKVTGRNFNIK